MSDATRTGQPLSIARFAAILDAYGAETRHWPAAERTAAETLLATSAEARHLHERASRLDRVLEGSVAPTPSPAVRAAILHAAPSPRPTPLRRQCGAAIGALTGALGGPRPAGALLGFALLLGVIAGGAVGTSTDPTGGAEIDIVHLALLDEQFPGY